MKRLLYGLLAFFVLFSACPGYDAQAAEESTEMSVKLKYDLGNVSSMTVTAGGAYKTSEGTPFMEDGEERIIKAESGKLVVYLNGEKDGTYNSLTLVPEKEGNLLSINKRPYLGSMEFTVEGKNVRPINHVAIEDYLKGVVHREMPAGWSIEALKAQAIAARTYALRYQSKVIDDTVSYQVYGGAEVYDHSNLAVDETKGLVLKYDGKLIDALFSSSNGGITELNSNVWTLGKPLPYLDIKEDPYSYDPKRNWNLSFDKQQIDLSKKDLTKPDQWWSSVKEKDSRIIPNLKSWLQANGYKNKDIKITDIPMLSFSEQTSGGRVSKGSIEIHFYVKDLFDEKGKLELQTFIGNKLEASQIRSMVGTNVMKSLLVMKSAPADANRIEIEGSGYGHGVGLSQYGAKARAEAGQSYQEILSFYYPHTELVKEYGDQPKDITAPAITGVKTKGDYPNHLVRIDYTLDEEANVTLRIKDATGKEVAVPIDREKQKGSQTAYWDIKDIPNGTYTAEITAEDRSHNSGTAVKRMKVNKDITAPKISKLKVEGNYSTEKASITYTLSEAATVTLQIKNAKGNVIAVPVNRKSLKRGNQTATWNFKDITNGSYTVNMTAKDASQNQGVATVSAVIQKTTGKVTASILNVREKASAGSKLIGQLKQNQTVTILAQEGNWYKIKSSTMTGYVSKTYIKK